MNIYSSVDKNNIDKIICLFDSVYINSENKNSLKFYLITDDIPNILPYIPDYLEEILEIKKVIFDDRWNNLMKSFNKSFYKQALWCKNNMNFARFLFFKVFPEVDRVIYLDWDMILQADIFELKPEYEQYDKMVIAHSDKNVISTNIFTEFFRKSLSYMDLFHSKGNKKIDKVFDVMQVDKKSRNVEGFNSGFYIVTRSHFEDKLIFDIISKLIKIQKSYQCFNFGTQVVMNFLCIDNRIYISKLWNHLPKIDDIPKIKNIHYNGDKKPWHNYLLPENKVWFDYYDRLYPEWKLNLKSIEESKEEYNNKKVSKNKIDSKKIKNNSRLLKYLSNNI